MGDEMIVFDFYCVVDSLGEGIEYFCYFMGLLEVMFCFSCLVMGVGCVVGVFLDIVVCSVLGWCGLDCVGCCCVVCGFFVVIVGVVVVCWCLFWFVWYLCLGLYCCRGV